MKTKSDRIHGCVGFAIGFESRVNIEDKLRRFGTGWSKETVDCNFLPTDKEILKSSITQWFLESLYREVLVFWCFKNARCVEFCLSEIFQYKTFAASYKAWTLICSLEGTQTLNTPINSTQIPFEKLLRHPPYISRHHRTLRRRRQTPKDTNTHQQMPFNVSLNSHTSSNCLLGCLGLSLGVCWCLLLSWFVPRYLEEVIVSMWVKCM